MACHKYGRELKIERITQKNICFKRIYVSGMYVEGECLDG